jgi:hypothetical protein
MGAWRENLMTVRHHNLTIGQSHGSAAEKLAESLEALKKLQDRGVVAIRAADLSRAHRERLLKNGFLREVMKGWDVACSRAVRELDCRLGRGILGL